jgi:thiamine pyrophosphokinase
MEPRYDPIKVKIFAKQSVPAKIRITVDGGTERWLSWLKTHHLDRDKITPPDLITGDMDSVPKDVVDYFVDSHKSKVVKTPDQNETDYTKALMELSKACAAQNLEVSAGQAESCSPIKLVFR